MVRARLRRWRWHRRDRGRGGRGPRCQVQRGARIRGAVALLAAVVTVKWRRPGGEVAHRRRGGRRDRSHLVLQGGQ